MKAESTIRKQMQELFRLAKQNTGEDDQAYDMATALQWVLNSCSWTPTSLYHTCREKR